MIPSMAQAVLSEEKRGEEPVVQPEVNIVISGTSPALSAIQFNPV
jgi:hypothetical protein